MWPLSVITHSFSHWYNFYLSGPWYSSLVMLTTKSMNRKRKYVSKTGDSLLVQKSKRTRSRQQKRSQVLLNHHSVIVGGLTDFPYHWYWSLCRVTIEFIIQATWYLRVKEDAYSEFQSCSIAVSWNCSRKTKIRGHSTYIQHVCSGSRLLLDWSTDFIV